MIITNYIQKYKYTRPGLQRTEIRGLVYHYPAAPRATPESYYRRLESFRVDGKMRYESYHYMIGMDGEIRQYIPDDEQAYHCGAWKYQSGITKALGPHPNETTIGICMCHPTASGRHEQPTVFYAMLLGAYLCRTYDLNPMSAIYRHFDVTGKDCPRWWVRYPNNYEALKSEIKFVMVRGTVEW